VGEVVQLRVAHRSTSSCNGLPLHQATSRIDAMLGLCIACWVLWDIVPTIALHSLQLVPETV